MLGGGYVGEEGIHIQKISENLLVDYFLTFLRICEMVELSIGGKIRIKEKTGKKGCIKPNLRRFNTMVNIKKVIMCVYIIIMGLSLSVLPSYSQHKPSDKTILDIIIITERGNSLQKYMKNVKINTFVITNNFISTKNGRYCVEVNLDVSYEGRNKILDNYKFRNDKLNNKRYSFVNKHNLWYGYIGWGPGED
jgi:hypothetical protein